MPGEAPELEPPAPRRRASWSLKTIVEDVAGRTLEDLQEPGRPVHPYVQAKLAHTGNGPSTTVSHSEPSGASRDLTEDDPVAHYSPPLSGAVGRAAHGTEFEHHKETIDHLGRIPAQVGPGSPPHPPGPSRRPERIYLHYLLLHLDHLSDTSLAYLGQAVAEELRHREAHRARVAPPAPAEASAEVPTPAPEPSPGADEH